MDDQAPQSSKSIDWLDTSIITALVTAFICDFLFFLIIPHYLGALVIIPIIWPKTRGLIAKAILILAAILPLPLLSLGIVLAVIFSNKFLAFIGEQAAIITAAAFTGGGALAAEGGALGVEGAAITAEGLEAAGAAAEGVGVAVEGAGAVTVGAAETAAASAEAAETVGEAAGEVAEGAQSEARETLRERVTRKLKEKAREKMRDMIEGGGDSDGDNQAEPTEEEIAAEMAREEELAEALGETPSPMRQLERGLFDEKSIEQNRRSVLNNEDEVALNQSLNNRSSSSARQSQVKNTQDIIAHTRAHEAEVERNRNSINDSDQSKKGPMAA